MESPEGDQQHCSYLILRQPYIERQKVGVLVYKTNTSHTSTVTGNLFGPLFACSSQIYQLGLVFFSFHFRSLNFSLGW